MSWMPEVVSIAQVVTEVERWVSTCRLSGLRLAMECVQSVG